MGVERPHGLRRNASTIYGNVQRGNGILLNEIYTGQIAWNKVSMRKDPTTGKRISRPKPVDPEQAGIGSPSSHC